MHVLCLMPSKNYAFSIFCAYFCFCMTLALVQNSSPSIVHSIVWCESLEADNPFSNRPLWLPSCATPRHVLPSVPLFGTGLHLPVHFSCSY
jgi:hypothetical protein